MNSIEDESELPSLTSHKNADESSVPKGFVAPVELPRRASLSSPHLINPAGGLRLPDMTIDQTNVEPNESISKSPKWGKSTVLSPASQSQLPKLVLFTAEQNPGRKRSHQETSSSGPEHISYQSGEHEGKKRKHSQKKEKRKRRRDQDTAGTRHSVSDSYDSYLYINPTKNRRRSGSSTSHTSTLSSDSFSPMPATSPPTEDVRRLAPLRIQLPRSIASQLSAPGSLLTYSESSCGLGYSSRQPSYPHVNQLRDQNRQQYQEVNAVSSENSKCLRLVQEICVTDITVGGVTISIKECSGPDNFFGVPSSQLVKLSKSSTVSLTTSKNETLSKKSPVITTLDNEISADLVNTVSPEIKKYADENVAPSVKTDPQHSSPCLPVIRTEHEAPHLSTIYEESSGDLSAASHQAAEAPTKVEDNNVPTSNSCPLTNLKTEKSLEPNTEVNMDSSNSTTALMLAATEAAMKSAAEACSSPDLLLPPRRSSTPVERSPPFLPNSYASSNGQSDNMMQSPSKVISSSSTTSLDSSKRILGNQTNCVTPNKVIASKAVTTTQGRPMATIFGQVRTKGTFSGKTSSVFSDSRKSKSKQSTITSSVSRTNVSQSTWSGLSNPNSRSLPPSRPVVLIPASQSDVNQTKTSDPASVYAFTGESPTYNLFPRPSKTSIPSSQSDVSSRINYGSNVKSKQFTKANPAIAPLVKCPTSEVPNTASTTGNELPQSSFPLSLPSANATPPVSSLDVNLPTNVATSVATALCLQQLQMQLMCSGPATAALFNALSSSFPTSTLLTDPSCPTSMSPSIGLPPSDNQTILPPNPPQNQPALLFPDALQPSTTVPMLTNDSNFLLNPLNSSNSAPMLSLPLPLQLADMVAAVVNCRPNQDLYTNQLLLNNHLTTFNDANDLPIDLSAKR